MLKIFFCYALQCSRYALRLDSLQLSWNILISECSIRLQSDRSIDQSCYVQCSIAVPLTALLGSINL